MSVLSTFVASSLGRGGPILLAAAGLFLVVGAGASVTRAAHSLETAETSLAKGALASGAHEAHGLQLLPAAGNAHVDSPVLARWHEPAPQPAVVPPRHLRIAELGGGPVLDVMPFDEHGYMRSHDFAAIAHAFRAHNDCEVAIHPELIEVLMELSSAFDERPIVLVSGHREPTHGTRTTSYHVSGLAADVAIHGVRSRELYKAAIRLGVPGVGWYGAFIHVDVRDDIPYRWSGNARRYRRSHR